MSKTTRPSRNRRRAPAPRAEIRGGDAFSLIEALPAETIDLLLTSPPYWGVRSYGLNHDDAVLERWRAAGCDESRTPPYDWYRWEGGVLGLEPYPEWYIDHLVEFFGRARPTLKATASLWVNLGDTYFARWSSIRDDGRQGMTSQRTRRRTPSGRHLHDKQLLMVPARFAIAMQDAGWILRNDLIWSKPHPMPRPEKDRLRASHEHWFHFVQRNPNGRPSYFYDLSKVEDGARDVVTCHPRSGTNGHSAAFPAELIVPRIASCCPTRGLVLDPFCGTGTTVIEAVRLGRRAIGFEAAKDHARSARSRLRRMLEEG